MTTKPAPPILTNTQIHDLLTAQPDTVVYHQKKDEMLIVTDQTFKSTDEMTPMVKEIESRFAESGITDMADGARAVILSGKDHGDNRDSVVTEVQIRHVDGDWRITDIDAIKVCPGSTGLVEIFLTDDQLEAIRNAGNPIEGYFSISEEQKGEGRYNAYLASLSPNSSMETSLEIEP